MKYNIITLGCQQNVHDSQRLEQLLSKLGFESVTEDEAEILFVVACSVKQSAVNRIYGKLKNFPGKQILLTACVLPEDKKKFAKIGVDFFDIEDFNSLKPILSLKIGGDLNLLADSQKASAYLPIMTGCNNFCSYCAVPFTRGREKSRSLEEIVFDFNKLIKAGHKEITLLGQNVNSYNPSNSVISNESEKSPASFRVIPDFDPGSCTSFVDLIKILHSLDGDFTIKFMTSHPRDMSNELIDAIADLPRIAKEIHLPLQSGSDKILKTMNRRYTKENYLDLVARIRSKIPGVVLTTDIIVGFPGETKTDFEATVDVAKKAKFNFAFISRYSPRSGTAAAKLEDDIPQEIKKERFRILDQLINR
jgi:tRNA-2-methylthio-N6-dimethylallyladenosine synthase